eukprot:scaffold82809_cov33-Phaeocystis_antarctica.AAC.1
MMHFTGGEIIPRRWASNRDGKPRRSSRPPHAPDPPLQCASRQRSPALLTPRQRDPTSHNPSRCAQKAYTDAFGTPTPMSLSVPLSDEYSFNSAGSELLSIVGRHAGDIRNAPMGLSRALFQV